MPAMILARTPHTFSCIAWIDWMSSRCTSAAAASVVFIVGGVATGNVFGVLAEGLAMLGSRVLYIGLESVTTAGSQVHHRHVTVLSGQIIRPVLIHNII